MTKNYFIQLANYNAWANDIVHSWLDKINDEQWQQPIVSSFKSIAETVVHTAGAEKGWLERLNKMEKSMSLAAEFKGTKQEAIAIWKKASFDLNTFVENLDETKLNDNISFMRPDNKSYELAHYQIFAHVLNHSTYHRGQLVTMLRQVGFTDVRTIDMSTYFWSLKK